MSRSGRGQTGTTLVELVVGLAVATLLALGVLTLVEQSMKSYMHSSEAADIQQNVRVAMDRMVRIIQAAGVNPRNQQWGGATPNDPAFTAIREAGRNCIRLYADLNGDTTVGGVDENVYFHWPSTPATGSPIWETRGTLSGQPDAGQPWVTAATASEELARDIVANPGGVDMFQYFTGPNDAVAPNTQLVPPPLSTTACSSLAAADRARIARVVITITGRATIGGEVVTKTLRTEARPRNVP
jgi:type II secretory pathway component PulJ